jgi:hypothetical protein
LKDTVNELFMQVAVLLVETGYLTPDAACIDGTKMESRASRYTFVRRKTVEKNKAKPEEKIRKVLEYIEEGIMQDSQPDDAPPRPVNTGELQKRIAGINASTASVKRSREEEKAFKKAVGTLEEKQLPKLEACEKQLATPGARNSYSKTGSAATFMRLKDGHMRNGQLKPACNLQTGTENQFISHFDFFPNPTDYLTFQPFVNGFKERFKAHFDQVLKKAVAGSGYGSEANCVFMRNSDIEAFVKFPCFHKEQQKAFNNNAFIAQNLFYNAEKYCFVCPTGQHMEKTGEGKRKSDSGFVSQASYYAAKIAKAARLNVSVTKHRETEKSK